MTDIDIVLTTLILLGGAIGMLYWSERYLEHPFDDSRSHDPYCPFCKPEENDDDA